MIKIPEDIKNKYDQKLEIYLSEYKTAKEELAYYSDLFNKQDNLYGVYFAIFAIFMGALYYIFNDSSNSNGFAFSSANLGWKEQVLCGFIIVFLSITYMYVFNIMMGNSYYLIIYGAKIVVLEEKINQYFNEDILIWQKEFMSIIQSKNNTITCGFLNVNYIKTIIAVLLYFAIQVPLVFLWWLVFGFNSVFWIYCSIIAVATIVLLWDWFRMWFVLPKHYENILRKLYKVPS